MNCVYYSQNRTKIHPSEDQPGRVETSDENRRDASQQEAAGEAAGEREGEVEPGGKVLQRSAMNLGVVLDIIKGHTGSVYDSEFVETQIHM